jgi:hypothetical protein
VDIIGELEIKAASLELGEFGVADDVCNRRFFCEGIALVLTRFGWFLGAVTS